MHIYGIKNLIRERDHGSLKLFNDYVITFGSIISILDISHFYISWGLFTPLIQQKLFSVCYINCSLHFLHNIQIN